MGVGGGANVCGGGVGAGVSLTLCVCVSVNLCHSIIVNMVICARVSACM